jgi:uncharacterized protein Yka (UPF0111/DUF47 family)
MDDSHVIDLTGPEDLENLNLRLADDRQKLQHQLMPEASAMAIREVERLAGSFDAYAQALQPPRGFMADVDRYKRSADALAQATRGMQPPLIQVPHFDLPDMPDLVESIAENKKAERDALSAIIERHTGEVRRAVDELNTSSQKAAEDAQSAADQIRRLTTSALRLTVIIAVSAVASVIAALIIAFH